MLAIIEIGGKQYRVAEGDVIYTDKVKGEVGQIAAGVKVLLTENNGKVSVGTPEVKGAKALLKILAQEKGEKIKIRRYKQKVRYRKARGFRPLLTKLEVVSLD